MADTLAIRRRIRSISSTRQITKAMQLVAASKLRAAATAAVNAQAYRRQLDDILTQVAGTQEWHTHPLLRQPAADRAHLVLIGSDHTLAGAYHSRLEALLAEVVAAEQEAGRQVEVTTIGRIPAAMPRRLQGVEIAGSYAGPAVLPTIWEVHTIVAELLQRYQAGEIGSLKVLTTRFVSALRQSTEVWDLLPLAAPNASAAEAELPGSTVANDSPQPNRLSAAVTASLPFVPPTLEPDPETAITQAAQTWLQAAFLDAATTAVASEHAMRMIAMQNATSNAGDLIDDLTLEYNNARQAAITQELAEITGGAAAIT